MNIKSIVIGVAALAAIGTGTALTGQAADAHSASTTMRLRVVPISGFDTRTGFVAINKDVNRHGRRVGSDVTTCRGKQTHPDKARCDVALALSHGLIYLTFTMAGHTNTAHGVVTGGTGTFRGVEGTVTIHEHPRHANAHLTLTR